MIRSKRLIQTALALTLGIGTLSSLPARAQEAMSFGLRSLEERFEAASPGIGKRVPNVPVYTAEGEKVRFRELVQGKHTVVVFGCLT
jgi:hypothetical protein